MHRLYVILFLFFLSSPFLTNAQEKKLVLKEVSIDTVYPQQIKLQWLFEEVDSVSIYKCVNLCNDENYYNPYDKVKMDVAELEWIDTTANTTSLNYYSIGWRRSGKSNPLNNMFLEAKPAMDSCRNSVLLLWNPYINMIDSLDFYRIFERKDTMSSFVLRDSIKGEHFTGYYYNLTNKGHYEAKNLANDTNYEFVIQAVSKTRTEQSFSNIVKFKTGFENNNPVFMEITCVSVEDQDIQIDVQTDTFVNPFRKLYLLRDESTKPVWTQIVLQPQIIDSMDYNSENRYIFKDPNVTPNSRIYYYMVVADNNCRAADNSNILSSIFLYGNRLEKYMDSIRFFQIEFPEIETTDYELFRVVNHFEILITDTLQRHTSYYVDATPFLNDGAVVKYRILSKKGCYSNSLTIEHEPVIEFPNAFYPQSKNIENQTFYPILKFPSEEHYLFVIYNRWGQELFRSILPPVYGEYGDMQGRWDGNFQGKECPSGMYAYKISYAFDGGLGRYSTSGTFMLIR